MKREAFPKSQRVLCRADYLRIQSTGLRVRKKHMVGLYLRLLLSPRMGFGRVQVTAPRRRAAVAPTLAARLALSRPRVVPRPALASPPLRRRGSRLHKA